MRILWADTETEKVFCERTNIDTVHLPGLEWLANEIRSGGGNHPGGRMTIKLVGDDLVILKMLLSNKK